MTFLDQRLEHDAQWEIQKYAEAVEQLSKDAFPEVFKAAGELRGN